MNSRAKIGTLAKTDPALLVPYRGEQRAIGELQALGITLTPEDYRVIRQSLGGGKRGRARARELVPLECPTCESRLTHYERTGREPYFAATVEGASHGPHCDAVSSAAPEAVADGALVAARVESASVAELAPVADVAPAAPVSSLARPTADVDATVAVVERAEVTALSEDDLEFASDGLVLSDAQLASPSGRAPSAEAPSLDAPSVDAPSVEAPVGAIETTYYFIEGDVEPSAGALRLGRLGLGSTPPAAAVEAALPRGTKLADARQLLIQALNRALPSSCVVRYRGQDYPVVAAADLHQRVEGERVAVYGRLTETEWNPQAGRLTLKATQRTVQVWATAAAPRQLLQVASTDWLEAPVLAKPMPFLAFGTLRRLGPTCGIPVIRGDSLVLLQPLTAVLREPSADVRPGAEQARPSTLAAARDGLAVLPEADEPSGRDSDAFEPRDSELYELYDSEPDKLLHDATAWNLGAVDARAGSARVESSLAHGSSARLDSPGAQAARFSAEPPSASEDARADGLELSPAGTSLAAPDLTAPARGRGALSTLRNLASSLRRSK